MSGIFNLDNGFFSFMSKLTDCILVSVLWIICCIPVVTAGAATTALYYTIHKAVHEDRGYVFREYMHSFKDNFRQSTIAWLILLVVGGFLGSDAYLTYQLKQHGDAVGNVFYLVILLLLVELIIWIYLFPYVSRFDDTLKTVFRNSFFIGFSNPLKTVGMLLTGLVIGYLVYLLPFLILIAPALYMLGIEQLMERIYHRFIPEEETE